MEDNQENPLGKKQSQAKKPSRRKFIKFAVGSLAAMALQRCNPASPISLGEIKALDEKKEKKPLTETPGNATTKTPFTEENKNISDPPETVEKENQTFNDSQTADEVSETQEEKNPLEAIVKETKEKYPYESFLFPVSQKRRLPEFFPTNTAEAPLVCVDVNTGGVVTSSDTKVAEVIVKPLEEMFAAARAEGHNPYILSGFRSVKTQEATFNHFVNTEKEKGKSQEEAEKAANEYSSRPFFSEHHTGFAVDIWDHAIKGWDNIRENYDQGFYEWLRENSCNFGFVISYPTGNSPYRAKPESGYPSAEPWHLRYVGEKMAKYLKEKDYINPDNNMTLDLLLKQIEKNQQAISDLETLQ